MDNLGDAWRIQLLAATALTLRLLVRLCFAPDDVDIKLSSKSIADVLLGRFDTARVTLNRARRWLRVHKCEVECQLVNSGINPMFWLFVPLMLALSPRLVLVGWLLGYIFLPRAAKTEPGRRETRFTARLSAEDLWGCRLWRDVVTSGLRDIMNYSVAGMVALPREVSGELSAATSFEVKGLQVSESCLILDAVANLPGKTVFQYRLKTGVSLGEVDGCQCIIWDDPCIEVTPGWQLPKFWAPIGSFAGLGLPDKLRFSRFEFLSDGQLVMEGRVAGEGSFFCAMMKLSQACLPAWTRHMERPEVEAVPSSSAISSFVSQAKLAFEYSLKNLLWKQAAFYAERLVAERPCDETTYLLGLAYFHNQELARAQWHLQGNKLPEARYLLARCCSQLKRWDLAEDALLPSSAGGNLNEVVNGAAGLFLFGQVQERQGRREQAVECYFRCLQECPFMWEAYERWSWLVLGSPSPSPATLFVLFLVFYFLRCSAAKLNSRKAKRANAVTFLRSKR
ncbi:CDC27B [Symbiodinium natans]|uniref:CDC27B protein n=1 Tax=Symbiodinium natans TaxID=878477 RepID=A0A812S5S6_9DINO|nr:CDC27B [Symbiodinium natans]